MHNWNKQLQELKTFLQQEESFLLLSHVLPDGDSVGSTIAFAEILKSMGKNCKILFRDNVPEIYHFLLNENTVYNLHTIDETSIPSNFIVLDCSEFERVGEELQHIRKYAKKIVNIDHHISNDNFGDIKLVKVHAAATCEVIYNILAELELEINQAVAKALYTGIVTDTGGFRYESTSKETFISAANLLEAGVDIGEIRENIFENKAKASINILQAALTNLEFTPDGQIAWMYVTSEDMDKVNATGEHCEGIVNYALSITGVKMGFFFRQMPDGKIKVGLRARRGFNVNTVASVFGGGGHAQAAGCTINASLTDAITDVIGVAGRVLQGEIS